MKRLVVQPTKTNTKVVGNSVAFACVYNDCLGNLHREINHRPRMTGSSRACLKVIQRSEL